ncbi:hypothetical protein ACMXY9_02300 [Pasteurella multocida]|uniref:hypothetical protein n=1 Tax=Pasteurella multocida TaxID=747 RepID=UPI003CF803CB
MYTFMNLGKFSQKLNGNPDEAGGGAGGSGASEAKYTQADLDKKEGACPLVYTE